MLHNEIFSGIWVYCEQTAGRLRPVSHELLGKARELAASMNRPITAVLLGADARCAASLASWGADNVLHIDDPSLNNASELRCADELVSLVQKYNPFVLLLGATAFGRSLAPRVAARLKTGLTADCTALDVDPETGLLLQTRPAFGGNLTATITCPNARPQMATVRPRVFPAPYPDYDRQCAVVTETPAARDDSIRLLEKIAGRDEINIGEADILVSVGQGVGGANNIRLAEKLASLLGGSLASSRPLVDSGMLPYARQVGQTGKTVAPKLYIALGISGAVQHMAGVAAENIVAVNVDPDAPIFQYARWGIVGDCGAFLREIVERLS